MKRRCFQIHFSTAIILIFVAAVLLGCDFLFCERVSAYYSDPSKGLTFWREMGGYVIAVLMTTNVAALLLVALLFEAYIRRRQSNTHSVNDWSVFGSSRGRWFQIHLSTATITMFAASCILWANIESYDHFEGPNPQLSTTKFGFPWVCYDANIFNGFWGTSAWREFELLGDMIVNFGTLALTVAVSEFLIRRREARKP